MRREGGGRPASANLDEILAKEPGAENGMVVAPPSHGARASARAQVLAERCQIDVARQRLSLGHDMAEMRRRPQIPHSGVGAIALPHERGGKTVEV